MVEHLGWPFLQPGHEPHTSALALTGACHAEPQIQWKIIMLKLNPEPNLRNEDKGTLP